MAAISFCPECNFMLHPEEDPGTRKLVLLCKMCNHKSDAKEQYVYVNKLKKDSSTRLDLVDTDLARDPTLPRTFETRCPKCKGKEAGGKGDDMSLVFLCCNDACLHKWIN